MWNGGTVPSKVNGFFFSNSCEMWEERSYWLIARYLFRLAQFNGVSEKVLSDAPTTPSSPPSAIILFPQGDSFMTRKLLALLLCAGFTLALAIETTVHGFGTGIALRPGKIIGHGQ